MRTNRPHRAAIAALCLASAALLQGCGGGGGGGGSGTVDPPAGPAIARFDSDQSSYFVGDRARLTAVYSGGEGRIEPGSLPIASGQTVETPVLSESKNFRLIVTNGGQSVFRDRTLEVGYRERTRTLQAPFGRSEHAAVILGDGSVLIVGGEDMSNAMPEGVWRFDPRTETFAPFVDLATGRTGHVAVALADDRVLVVGGARALTGSPAAEIIDTRAKTARATRGQPTALRRSAAAAMLADGRVLIVGGGKVEGGELTNTAEIFDPATEQFTPTAGNLQGSRYAHTATRLADGRVLVYGGFGAVGGTGDVLPAEIYDPRTGRFTTIPTTQPEARALHAAIGMPDGSVWMVGGETPDGLEMTSVVRFDPSTGAFARVPDLITGRSFARALTLTDGRVLAVGGNVPGAFASESTELLSADGRRRAGPPLAAARALHSVTPLVTTGKVLVFGGLGADRTVLSTAEIFE